ncbi:MAG TPA: hypothetical protein VJ810_34335 [Blastocatellia bacterium]|nr:hypothetical protein [Blastocatellia bacterium]
MKEFAISIFLLFSIAATASAQNQTVEYGSADELKDVTKVFMDTGTDMDAYDDIIAEIRKKLREVKRELKFVSKPEDSDVHLRFSYETLTLHGGERPPRVILSTPVGSVVKILSKDRVRVLMSYSKKQRSFRIGFGQGKPEIEFAREFVKVYLVANSKKQEQLPIVRRG